MLQRKGAEAASALTAGRSVVTAVASIDSQALQSKRRFKSGKVAGPTHCARRRQGSPRLKRDPRQERNPGRVPPAAPGRGSPAPQPRRERPGAVRNFPAEICASRSGRGAGGTAGGGWKSLTQQSKEASVKAARFDRLVLSGSSVVRLERRGR